MKRNSSGMGVYLIFLAVMFIVYFFMRGDNVSDGYTMQNMRQAVENAQVKKVEIYQNAEVPTGYLKIYLKDESVKTINVSDITEVEDYLEEMGVSCYLHAVPRESVFLTSILPMLMMMGLVIFLFLIMNRQASGGNNRIDRKSTRLNSSHTS